MTQSKSSTAHKPPKRQHDTYDGPAHSDAFVVHRSQMMTGKLPPGEKWAAVSTLFDHLDIATNEWAVLIALSQRMDHEYPGMGFLCDRATLAKTTKLHPSSVTRAVASLEDRGYLCHRIVKRQGNIVWYWLFWKTILDAAEAGHAAQFDSSDGLIDVEFVEAVETVQEVIARHPLSLPPDEPWDENDPFYAPVTSAPGDDHEAVMAAQRAKINEGLARMNGSA